MQFEANETLEMSEVPAYAKKGGLYFADVLGTYEVEDGVYTLSLRLKASGFTGGAHIILAARMRAPYELALTLPDARPGEVSKVFPGIQAIRHMSGQKPVASFNLRANFDAQRADGGMVTYAFSLEGKSVKLISNTRLGR
ncbi:MAG: hypothetical protein ACE5PO_04710 [Candidatus Bathyarchaeia archaeon]